MTYAQAMEFIGSFTVSGAPVTGLSRINALLQSLGRPQDSLRFIHIAGTNGKGSALEMISCGLAHSGVRTGQLTSPFIRCYRDRIRIDGVEIPESAVRCYAERICAAKPQPDCSQFEITLAIALMYFADEKCGAVCMEAGIGGLLDATNFVREPLLSVIMTIALDHTALLGDTTEEIAAQKAGIIKPGCPCVFYPRNGAAVTELLTQAADEAGSRYIIPDCGRLQIIAANENGSDILYDGESYHIAMRGEHQIYNAITAIEGMRLLGLGTEAIRAGLAAARVPARLERLQADVYFDGAHNPDGARALAHSLPLSAERKTVGVCGMLTTKDYESCAARLAGKLSAVICIDGFAPKAVNAQTLADCFAANGAKAYTADSFENALREARRLADGGDVIVFGSLYLYEIAIKKD